MNRLDGIVIGYALLNLLFGILGYFRGGSTPSLVGGVAVGILILFGITLAKSHPKVGYGVCAVVTALVLFRFIVPAIRDMQFYPAMILVAASLVAFVALAIGHFAARREPNAGVK